MNEVYTHDGFTRVAYRIGVDDLQSPTLDEVVNSTDLTCDLALNGGLRVVRNTKSVDVGLTRRGDSWGITESYTTRAELSAARRASYDPSECDIHVDLNDDCCVGTLWEVAYNYRGRGVLIIRRGIDVDAEWEGGQPVETVQFRWGKRSTAPSTHRNFVMMTVPLIVQREYDNAIIEGVS